MSSPLSAGSGNDAIMGNREAEITNNPIMVGQQQNRKDEQQQEDHCQPSGSGGNGGGAGEGSSGIKIFIHSPTTTTSSGGSSGERENQIQQYNRPKMFRKLSNSSSIISEIFKHPTDEDAEERLREKIRRANERDNESNNIHNTHSRELIQLLSTNLPPPLTATRQSRMSFSSLIPRGVRFSSSSTTNPANGKGKSHRASFWAACKKLKTKLRDQSQNLKENRKEKGKESIGGSTTPEPASFLVLPDSAVAGRTSGGHRYIGISIPIEEGCSGDEGPTTSRTSGGRKSMSPSIRQDQVPRKVSSIAARRPKTASNLAEDARPLLGGNHLTPEHTTRPRQDELRPPSRHLEHARPHIADPPGSKRNTFDSFGSSEDSVTGHYPIRNHSFEYSGSIDIHESPEGLSVRGRHHWSLPAETSRPRQHEQGSQSDASMVRNGSGNEVMQTNAPALPEYPSENAHKRHPPAVSRLRRMQSVLSFQGIGIALTTSDLTEERSMGQLRYREIINHHSSSPNPSSGSDDGQGQKVPTRSKSPRRPHNLRSLTINLPPPYHHGQHFVAPASAVGVVTKPLSNDSIRRLEEQSKVLEPEPLRFSSIMTVADVKPSSSAESLQPGAKADNSSGSNDALLPERPPLSAVFVPQIYHHRPSIDEVMFSSPSLDPPYPMGDGPPPQSNINTDAAAESRPAQANVTTGTGASGEVNEHKITRSPSHQALVHKYEALRETRERELGLLVDRLEVLEHKNEWWLNSVVPMVDSMAKRLTRVYDDQSLPWLTRERARIMRRDIAKSNSNSGGDVSNSSSFDSFLPPIALPSPLQMQNTTAQDSQPREQKTYSDRHRLSLTLGLEPESSLESFDSFSANRHHSMPQHRRTHSHPVTSVASRAPSPPYPDSYMFTEQTPKQLAGDHGQRHGTEKSRSRFGSADTSGSIYSNDSVPVPRKDMTSLQEYSSSSSFRDRITNQPPPQDSPTATATSSEAGFTYDFSHGFGSSFSHGMGPAVDRLPSRHGEKSLLNTISLPGGGASRSNSYGSGSQSYSSTRTIDNMIASGSAAEGSVAQQAQSQPLPRSRSRPRPRPRPHSLFILRQTSQEHDEAEGNSLEEENVFEESRRPRLDERRVRIQENTDHLNDHDHERISRNIRWIPSFSTVTSSSSGERPRVRPISWPSSYGPPMHTQTQAQAHIHTQGRSHHRPSVSTPAAISVPVPMTAPISSSSSAYMAREAGAEETEGKQNQQEKENQIGENPANTRTGQEQQQQQQQQNQQTTTATKPETEWDTLEPLMRGLMETSRLDLELGRDLDLDLDID